MPIESKNPATGETIRVYPPSSAAEVERAIEASHVAYHSWRETSFAERASVLSGAARLLRQGALEFGQLMALEMGKPVKQGRSEAEKCAWVCEYYARNAAAFLAPERVETDARRSFVAFEPMGPILAIMPWNFPFWQVFRFGAPALMAGNTVLLKHAPTVPGCALAIEDLFRRAGLPAGVFQALLVEVDAVGAVIADPRVRGVTLTGSVRAGRAVASAAGHHLKKAVLELGGSDPYLVLEDADLEQTIPICATGRLVNAGQSCIAAKRFLVVEPLRSAFEEAMVGAMCAARLGDPMSEDVLIGPMARADLRDELHRQVEESVAQGARLLLGGRVPEGKGFYYPATVLADVRPGMPAHDEELFGPVAAVIGVRDEEEAIRIANRSEYGLGAAVFTRDLERGERIATRRLEAGCAFVNAFVRSDPRLPFGGVKNSGYGRELSRYGILEWVNVKTIYVG